MENLCLRPSGASYQKSRLVVTRASCGPYSIHLRITRSPYLTPNYKFGIADHERSEAFASGSQQGVLGPTCQGRSSILHKLCAGHQHFTLAFCSAWSPRTSIHASMCFQEGRAKAKELAEFAKLQQSQRKDAANKAARILVFTVHGWRFLCKD